jgi:asparagine synthase (glutamine-hydrolysing)
VCGIAGGLAVTPNEDVSQTVRAITASQHARGPDAQSVARVVCDGGGDVVLGHNRLSIIDLTTAANQPMTDPTGRWTVVFNGELYNYVELREELAARGRHFRTASDTEVLLAAWEAWGEAALPRFYGMFAFGLWDAHARQLTLVRDRFGVKPLYWWSNGATMYFGSTPAVIARHVGAAPSFAYLDRGIRFKYYEDDDVSSPFDGVHALPGGTMLVASLDRGAVAVSQRRWYDVTDRVAATTERLAGLRLSQAESSLRELLTEAITLRQRSDVPVGLSVSGGVDSSAIAGLYPGGADGVRGYSFAHPDDRESEGPLVAEVAAATGLDMRWVTVPPAAVVPLFDRTLAAQGAPFPHVTVMAQHAVFAQARADGTAVMLGGQGGDEAFMGYRKFFLFEAQRILRERHLAAIPGFTRAVVPLVAAVARRATLFWRESARYRAGTGMASGIRWPVPASTSGMQLAPGMSPRQRQILDVTRYSLPTLLRYEDRNSMGNSVESRLPFLDHRVMEFGLALPTALKLGDGFGKLVLRRAIAGAVPDRIRLNRDKRGFDVNQARWIACGLGEKLRAELDAGSHVLRDFLPDAGRRPSTYFPDARLVADPQAFKEAVSLIWVSAALR